MDVHRSEVTQENIIDISDDEEYNTQRTTRSRRRLKEQINFTTDIDDLKTEHLYMAFEEIETVFNTIDEAAELLDIPIGPYLPEPKSQRKTIRGIIVVRSSSWSGS